MYHEAKGALVAIQIYAPSKFIQLFQAQMDKINAHGLRFGYPTKINKDGCNFTFMAENKSHNDATT